MDESYENFSESKSRERRKNRRPDQSIYQPPCGRQAKSEADEYRRKIVQNASPERSRDSSRFGSNGRCDGRDKESLTFKTTERGDFVKDRPRVEGRKSHSTKTHESDEFNRIFRPLMSGEFEMSNGRDSVNNSGRSSQRDKSMKTKNRSLQSRNPRRPKDDDDDEVDVWKSFDRSKMTIKNNSHLSFAATRDERNISPIDDLPRNNVRPSRKLETFSNERRLAGIRNQIDSDEMAQNDLVFIDDEDDNFKANKPLPPSRPSNGNRLWNPDIDSPLVPKGVVLPERNGRFPKKVHSRPREPLQRKAVDPEFVRKPVVKVENSKYVCINNGDQQQQDNRQVLQKLDKKEDKTSRSNNKVVSKSGPVSQFEVELAEVTAQGSELTALLHKFAGQDKRANSTSDRSASGRRSDSRNLSQGSGSSGGYLSDREIEGILEEMSKARSFIGNHLKKIIISNPEVAIKRGLCDAMWRLGFYQTIEVMRSLVSDGRKASDHLVSSARDALLGIVSEGITFYEEFVKEIQSIFGVNFMDPENKDVLFANSLHLHGDLFATKLSSSQKLVSIICYQVAINVGDLERYKGVETTAPEKPAGSELGVSVAKVTENGENARNGVDAVRRFLDARWWYLKAHQLNAKFGKPFHQLAVISQLMKRRLDAVYFHLRNLNSRIPVESGHEELQFIFHGVWKRVTSDEKKKKQERAKKKEKKMKTFKMSGRVEIWIRPNGKKETMDDSDDEVDDDSAEYLNGMDVIELNRKFLLDYLVTMGRLYTKIGMENYKSTAVIMLNSFRILLSSSPIIITEERLFQLLAINMAVIQRHENNAALREEVISLTMEMLALLCECYFRLIGLLEDRPTNGRASPAFGTLKELNQVMGAIKVFSDWLLNHAQLWNPHISSLLETFGDNKVALSKHLINFFNSINHLSKTSSVSIQSIETSRVRFSEEEFFRGFVPLPVIGGDSKLEVSEAFGEEKQLALARISQLKTIIDGFTTLETPIISIDSKTDKYLLCPLDQNRSAKTNEIKMVQKRSDDDDDVSDLGDDDDDDVIIVSSELISEEESEEEMTKPEEPVKVVSERGLELVVRPKHVVLDTNCLVHNFRNVKILLESKLFTIVVPLIVIKELEKLEKRGSFQHHGEDKEFNDWLKVQSGLALEFLRKEFKDNNRYLKAATINGNIMNNINFTNEDYTEAKKSLFYDSNNDDLILVCCKKLCQGKGNETLTTSPNEPEKKNRNVVLVTNDKILRIKAFNEEVPSRNVPKFMHWAELRTKK